MVHHHEATLLKTLLGLVSPCGADYIGHARRTDKTYGVVVRTTTGLRTLVIGSGTLSLAEEGILVEQDRFMICNQLGQSYA